MNAPRLRPVLDGKTACKGKGHEGHNAMPIGRDFADFKAVIRTGYRRHPFRFIGSQVFCAKIAARLFGKVIDSPSNLTAVIAFAVAFSKKAQGLCVILKADQIARARGPVLEESFKQRGKHFVLL